MPILIVEDNDDFRYVLVRWLRHMGYTVIEAADAFQALDCIRHCRPAIVLTDFRMPKLDGLELIRRLRQMPALHDVPMIVCTADLVDEIEEHARDVGATDVIAKPIDMPSLAERLAYWHGPEATATC